MRELDPSTIRAAARGDTESFTEVVREYQVPLVRYLTHLLGGDRTLAEDTAQETLLKCFQHLHRYQFQGKFSTWLFQIAHNTALDALRSQTRRRTLIRRLTPAQEFDAADGVLATEVRAALASLSPRLREPLVLVDVVGLRYREAAEVLSIPEGTVKSRVSHARLQLATWFTSAESSSEGAGDAVS